MNDNGYIRKIDDLGRIVIPKEVRKRLKIHEGENLIINTSDKNINLSKYSYVENNHNFINKIGDKISFLTDFNIIVTDLEHIIYSNQEFNELQISKDLKTYISNRTSNILTDLELNNQEKIIGHIVIEPIIANSICIGLVILYHQNNHEYISKIAKLIASIISIHVDES